MYDYVINIPGPGIKNSWRKAISESEVKPSETPNKIVGTATRNIHCLNTSTSIRRISSYLLHLRLCYKIHYTYISAHSATTLCVTKYTAPTYLLHLRLCYKIHC